MRIKCACGAKPTLTKLINHVWVPLCLPCRLKMDDK